MAIMPGKEPYEDVSSSQEREEGFQAKIRKLRKRLDEAERLRKEGLEKRGKVGGATEGSDEVGKEKNPTDQTEGNQTASNGLTGERDHSEASSRDGAKGGDGRREGERWKQNFESEVRKEVRRRMHDREASRYMTNDNVEYGSNPRQHERHREQRGQDMRH